MASWLRVGLRALSALVVLGLLACGTLFKPPDPDRNLKIQTEGLMFESDRGYRFAVLPEPSTKLVRLEVRYPVGEADDPPGKEGLAHLVEHLLTEVEITRDGKKTSISAESGRLGLYYNAFTTSDYTSFEVLAAPAALDELIALEVDRLAVGCAGLTREIVAREREVVINEMRERMGASGAALARSIKEAVYPAGHPYRAVDSVESIAKLELEDVCGFLVGPYRRGMAMVVASGAIDDDTLKTAATRHFGRLPRRSLTARPAPPMAPARPGTVRLRGDVDEPHLIATWPLPPVASRDYRLLEMAWSPIAGRLESFAFTYGWGNEAYATIFGGAHAPVLAVGINLSSASDLDEAISSIEKSVRHAFYVVQSPGETRDSLYWRGRWEERVESLLARWESIGGRSEMIASFMQFEPNGSLVKLVEELATSTPGETRRMAEKWLAPRRARYLLIEPSGQSGLGARTYLSAGAASHRIRVDDTLADQPLAIPAAGPRLATERYTMSNGLDVVLWPHGDAPLVHGRLVIDSGSAHDPAGKEGISQLVGAYAHADHLVFSNRELATTVDDLIGMATSELRQPGYGLSDETKDYIKGRLRQQRAKERRIYQRDLLTAIYGAKHPYARVEMTEDSIDNLSHDTVMSWARRHIVPRNATLIIAGKFDPSLIKKHIAYRSDQVSGGSDSKEFDLVPVRSQRWITGTTTKASPTVELDVSFVGGLGVDRDHARRLVLEGVISSQLAMLRGDKAITYGMSASFSPRRAGGLWTISGEVDAARAAEAATALMAILAELRRDPESYRGAFVLARQKAIESLLVDTNNSAAIANTLEFLARFDLPDDYFHQLAVEIAGMTLADFHPFVAKELAVTGQVFGAFGNRAAATAAVAAAKTARSATTPASEPATTPPEPAPTPATKPAPAPATEPVPSPAQPAPQPGIADPFG